VALIDNKVTCLTGDNANLYMEKVRKFLLPIAEDPASLNDSVKNIVNILSTCVGVEKGRGEGKRRREEEKGREREE
jgi:hypothetical protein